MFDSPNINNENEDEELLKEQYKSKAKKEDKQKMNDQMHELKQKLLNQKIEDNEEKIRKNEEKKRLNSLPLEEKIQLTKMKNKIKRWKLTFKDELKDYIVKDDMTYDELVELEKEIQFVIGSNSMNNNIQTGVITLTSTFESIAPKYGLNVQGLSNCIMTNDQFIRCLKEIQCIHSGDYSSPYYRMIQSLAYTSAILHLTNTKKMNQEVESNLEKKNVNKDAYKDL